jgi:2-isopropylmalate synthase
VGQDPHIAQARVAETPPSGHRPLRGGITLPVKRHIFIDRKSLPSARIYVATHQARQLPSEVADYQTPHEHNTDEFYFFIGDNPDLSGLEGQIKFEGKTHRIISPATVYIPTGTVHEYKVTKGEGIVVVLFRDLDYKHIAREPDEKKSQREAEKYRRYILRPDIRPTSEIKFHRDTAPGDRYVFMDSKKIPEANFYTIVRNAFDVKADQSQYVDPHRHNCDTYHLFIGNGPDYTGLTGEMVIDGKESIVASPAAVHVLEGVPHYYRLIGGSGKFFNVVPKGNYNESLL